MTHYINTII